MAGSFTVRSLANTIRQDFQEQWGKPQSLPSLNNHSWMPSPGCLNRVFLTPADGITLFNYTLKVSGAGEGLKAERKVANKQERGGSGGAERGNKPTAERAKVSDFTV